MVSGLRLFQFLSHQHTLNFLLSPLICKHHLAPQRYLSLKSYDERASFNLAGSCEVYGRDQMLFRLIFCNFGLLQLLLFLLIFTDSFHMSKLFTKPALDSRSEPIPFRCVAFPFTLWTRRILISFLEPLTTSFFSF